MGLTWAAGWAGCGVLIGVSSLLIPRLSWAAFFRVFDAPLPALGVPGFFGGALFSLVLGIAGRRRRFEDLSFPLFTLWGAVGGVMLSLLPAALVLVGLATPNGDDPALWRFTSVIVGPVTVLSALSAAMTLLIARKAQRRSASDGLSDQDVAELSEGDQSALGGGAAYPRRDVPRDVASVRSGSGHHPPTE